MLNWKKHKVLMVQILKKIYENKFLRVTLGFKGGTAGHFFYELPRYSVDLDFDLLAIDKKEEVFDQIKLLLSKYGQIKDQKIKQNTIFFIISYGGLEHNIKVEISTRNWGNTFVLKNYFGIAMRVITPEDMFANKLIALTGRVKFASRDVFDVYYFFSSGWDINEEIIKKHTGVYLEKYLKSCVTFLQENQNKNILQGLGELLDEKQKNWVKNNLVKDLIFLIKALEN